MDTQILGDALISLVPPFLVGIIFYVMLRSILRADSKERKVYAQMEEQMRAEQAETVKKAPKLAPKTTAKVTKSTKK